MLVLFSSVTFQSNREAAVISVNCIVISVLKFCFKTCVAMKFVDDDDDDDPSAETVSGNS